MGMPEYADFLDLAQRYPGVHLDTTMVFTDFAERDAPFPRDRTRAGSRTSATGCCSAATSPTSPTGTRMRWRRCIRLELGEEWLRGVCYGNGARLFGV